MFELFALRRTEMANYMLISSWSVTSACMIYVSEVLFTLKSMHWFSLCVTTVVALFKWVGCPAICFAKQTRRLEGCTHSYLNFWLSLFAMRPRSQVQSALLHKGEYIPTKVELNSWVALQPGRTGESTEESRKYNPNSILDTYKAQVLEFRVAPGSTTISSIRIQHAYMHRQLCLDPNAPTLPSACNCKWSQPLNFCTCLFPMIPCS